jgi:hypothetical protein
MGIKNGVPGETRDAAAAEAVWGSPGPTKVQSKKQINRVKMKRRKNDRMNIS